jgi:hypothetical protein
MRLSCLFCILVAFLPQDHAVAYIPNVGTAPEPLDAIYNAMVKKYEAKAGPTGRPTRPPTMAPTQPPSTPIPTPVPTGPVGLIMARLGDKHGTLSNAAWEFAECYTVKIQTKLRRFHGPDHLVLGNYVYQDIKKGHARYASLLMGKPMMWLAYNRGWVITDSLHGKLYAGEFAKIKDVPPSQVDKWVDSMGQPMNIDVTCHPVPATMAPSSLPTEHPTRKDHSTDVPTSPPTRTPTELPTVLLPEFEADHVLDDDAVTLRRTSAPTRIPTARPTAPSPIPTATPSKSTRAPTLNPTANMALERQKQRYVVRALKATRAISTSDEVALLLKQQAAQTLEIQAMAKLLSKVMPSFSPTAAAGTSSMAQELLLRQQTAQTLEIEAMAKLLKQFTSAKPGNSAVPASDAPVTKAGSAAVSPTARPTIYLNPYHAPHPQLLPMIPSPSPTPSPTASPTRNPTSLPSSEPSSAPSEEPTGLPTQLPTATSTPTLSPTLADPMKGKICCGLRRDACNKYETAPMCNGQSECRFTAGKIEWGVTWKATCKSIFEYSAYIKISGGGCPSFRALVGNIECTSVETADSRDLRHRLDSMQVGKNNATQPLRLHGMRITHSFSPVVQANLRPGCADGQKSDDETDVDCGGGTCDPCMLSRRCLRSRDCISYKCSPAEKCVDHLEGETTPAPTSTPTAAPSPAPTWKERHVQLPPTQAPTLPGVRCINIRPEELCEIKHRGESDFCGTAECSQGKCSYSPWSDWSKCTTNCGMCLIFSPAAIAIQQM